MRVSAALLLTAALLSCVACRGRVEQPEEAGRAVWFVHATDPHLFSNIKEDPEVRSHQERLNQAAFSDLIHGLSAVPGLEAKPSFLLVTGDLGLDRFGPVVPPPASAVAPQVMKPADRQVVTSADQPAPAGVTPAERDSAVSLLAEQLKASPVKDIYFVLGNNDVANEAVSGPALDAAATFLSDVQKRIAPSGVVLHDLTSCYRDKAHLPSGCSFDIPETDFRLIGFSSYSFKNDGANYGANQAEQEAEVQQLAAMVHQAETQGKKVLIVTHIAEIDDPFPLGQSRFLGSSPKKSQRPDWAIFSPWNVSPAVYQTWKEIVDSGAVAGVLAGHFHDSHKELYYRPYRWATTPRERADVRKLFLAPPLAVRLQDTSPIQARGYALFRLAGDEVRRNFYWYDPEGKAFKPDAPLPKSRPVSSNPFSSAVSWLWEVVLVAKDLSRAVVIAIAFLAAFLTAVQLWEVPPARSRLAAPAAAAEAPTTTTTTTTSTGVATTSTGVASTLTSNFAKTVLAGLGGMLALDFLGAIWNLQDINAKAYYVLMFVVFFFFLLLLYAFFQSLIESLRSRIATRRQPPPPTPGFARRHGGRHSAGPLWGWTGYWRNRIWRWLLSLRSFGLIFLDTFFNVLRGRNQLRTKIFEDTIIDLHRSIVRAADRIRAEVDAAVVDALKGKDVSTVASDVRVSVTILSEDESTLYYISRERGSLAVPFDKHSVAWISAYTGEARWFKKSYLEKKDTITLLDNSAKDFPSLPAIKLPLGSFFQNRPAPDYEAFVVLPVPLLQRSAGEGYRRGAIHISLRKEDYLEKLWSSPEVEGDPVYDQRWRQFYENIQDKRLGAVLHESLEVLGELLRSFNDAVFEDYILPDIQAGA
jgi:hypothetical protein